MGIVPTFFLKQEKNPVNIAIYVSLSTIYASALVGGFVDFVYNIGAIFVFAIFAFIKVVSDDWKIKVKV